MAEFRAKINKIGNGFDFPPKGRMIFLEYAKKHAGRQVVIKTILPESENMRDFYHGAVLIMWAYLDGKDYHDPAVMEDYHELGKLEFNAKVIETKTGQKKVGQSTRGVLNDGYLEKLIDYLEENYGIKRQDALNPEHYKDFRDRIYMNGQYEDYIEYLQDLKLVPIIHS